MRIPPAEIALASILISLGVILIAYGLFAMRNPVGSSPQPTLASERHMSDDEEQPEGEDDQQQNQLRA